MTAPRSIHLGANVYHHGWQHQNRLLADCVQPLLKEIDAQGIPLRFWFDRFDTRGPHVFSLLTVPEPRASEVRHLLSRTLDAYLAEHSTAGALDLEQVEAFHK